MARNWTPRTSSYSLVDPKTLPQIEKTPYLEKLSAKSSADVVIILMCDRPPTNNLDVRLALKYAIDREKVLRNVFKGEDQVGNDHPVSPVAADQPSTWPTTSGRSSARSACRRLFSLVAPTMWFGPTTANETGAS